MLNGSKLQEENARVSLNPCLFCDIDCLAVLDDILISFVLSVFIIHYHFEN